MTNNKNKNIVTITIDKTLIVVKYTYLRNHNHAIVLSNGDAVRFKTGSGAYYKVLTQLN